MIATTQQTFIADINTDISLPQSDSDNGNGAIATATATKPQLNSLHYKECVEQRGLDVAWVLPNCFSVTANEATQRLGYRAQSDGIWLEGCNHQSQLKPDKPWKQENDKRAPKYRSQTGEYDAMLLKHPKESNYWDGIETLKERCWQIDGHPCIVLPEGFFKAIAGCSNDIPSIALPGVEMGLTSAGADLQGKRYLVPTLERYAKAGFGFIVAFDADCAANENVIKAQRKLAHQLKLFKVPVYSATGLWTVAEGKGMDDYIQNHGADKFKREVLGKVVDIEAWEKQFQTPDALKTGKLLPADIVGRGIIEDYRDRLLYNDEFKSWLEYGIEREGVWMPVSEAYIESLVDKILESKNITGYNSASYVTNIVAKMRRQLFERVWAERPISEILPFTDGVLELATGQFQEHAPGHRLTWCLPRPYNAIATGFNKIDKWLDEATLSNDRNKQLLIHFAAAILRGRCDLHKFLHLIGVGGSGKSSFTRLIESLIGSQNCWNGSLQDLEDKHSVADLLGKRLVILPDQDKTTASLSNFKRLTGQDSLRGRRLYKDGLNFRFPGMAIVTSNAPIFHGGGSWLTRRIIMLAFDHKPAVNKIRDLEAEFEPELSAFTSHLLSIPNEEITRVLRGVGTDEVDSTLWQSSIRTESIAAFVNDQVIHSVEAQTQIGGDRNEWATERYNPITSTLFGAYSYYCRISGLQAKGKNNFSADLIELCQQTLGWAVSYGRDNQGRRVIRGLRLRSDGDTTPTLDDALTTDNLSDNPSDNPSDNLKPSQSNDSDNPDNLLPLKLCENKNILEEDRKINQVQIEISDNLSVKNTETSTQPLVQVVSEVVSEVDKQVVSVVSEVVSAIAPASDNLTLEIGDRVIGPLGSVEQIARFTQGGYLTISNNFISRADLKAAKYNKIPTVPLEETPAQVSALKVGDLVFTPNGETGIVEQIYPDGELGVSSDNGRFMGWKSEQLRLVSLSDGGAT